MRHTTRSALLIVDMINAFDFPGAQSLLRETRPIGPRIVALKRRARAKRCPVIYCNDNFGDWQADFTALIAACVDEKRPARNLIRTIEPDVDDYFILKPRHSAFYETGLESLLENLRVRRLVLCGIAGEGCIHATATDAHMRKYEVVVVRDATASQTRSRNRTALTHLENASYATIRPAASIRF